MFPYFCVIGNRDDIRFLGGRLDGWEWIEWGDLSVANLCRSLVGVDVTALRFLRMTLDVSADIEEMETECHDQASSSSSSTSRTSSSASAVGKANSELKQSRQEDESGSGGYTMKKLLTTKELRLPLVITVVLQIAQQLSGINAVS